MKQISLEAGAVIELRDDERVNPWSSSRSGFASCRAHLATFRDIFGCHDLGPGMCHWLPVVGRSQRCC